MGKPKSRVTNLSVKRDGNAMKASWKNPGDLTKGGNAASSMDVRVWLDRAGAKPVEADIWYSNRGKERPVTYTAADRFWAKGFERAGSLPTSFDKNYDRSRFHPLAAGRYLKEAKVGVAGYKGGFGPWAWATLKIGLPRAPKVTWAYDQGKAVATVTVETDEGKDANERYDTMVCVKIRRQDGKEAVLLKWTATRSAKWTRAWDLSGYITQLQAGKYVEVRCYAYARGLAGDNPAAAKAVCGKRAVVFPLAGTAGKPTCDRKDARGRIKVPVSSDSWAKQLQLQRKVGESGGWSDVSGATDNQNAKALYDSYGDVMPDPGEYVWYRIKATRDGYTDYSAAVRADCIYTAKPKEACSATCKLASITSSADGTQLAVVMAWKDSTANTGCELSWSPYANGWNTSEAPTVAQVTGKDSSTKLKGWTTRTHTISGLAPGDVLWLRMRRYRACSDGETRYSAYDIAGKATKAVTESASDDACTVLSVDVSGAAATVTVGIAEDAANKGTEITWADSEAAWRSNVQPESFCAEWAPSADPGDPSWPYKQEICLRGLEAGRTYWVRARRYDSAGGYSAMCAARQFAIPAGAAEADYDPRCGLVSVEPCEDGASAQAVIGWDGDHTGCEATWSADPGAWESSDRPSSFEFEWEDAESKSDEWSHTSTCRIAGLAEGETCYVRARSYYDGDGRAWSAYTEAASVTPFSAPSSVALEAPASVARGAAIECWWEVQSDQEQSEWHIHDAASPLTAIAEGAGSLCRASIDPERYGGASSISFYVEAGCGGGLARSNTVTVGIADIPACTATCGAELAAQPASFEVVTDDAAARLLAACYSRGCTMEAPDGPRDQLDGDCVWTQALSPAWQAARWDGTDAYARLAAAAEAAAADADAARAAFDATPEAAALAALDAGDDGWADAYNAAYATAEGAAYADALAASDAAAAALSARQAADTVYRAVVEMPVCDLYDGGSYYAEFRAVEQSAGLASEPAQAAFTVAYAHQAPEPPATITIDADADARKATITLSAPEGAAEGDVYDIYRQTPAGYELVAAGLAADAETCDPYAPFGQADTAYRIACRTADGDIAWAEFPYSMDVRVLRFDWEGESVELPWNIEVRERYQKDFEARRHLDGSVNGYFDRGAAMTGGYTTDVRRTDDMALVRLARRVGSHAGPVWVRDGFGKAMQCDVELDEAAMRHASGAVGLSFSISAMRTTAQFMPVGKEE